MLFVLIFENIMGLTKVSVTIDWGKKEVGS